MSVEVERVVPYAGNDEDKGTQVKRMFNRIAGRYDLLNGMLSLGFDRGWRRKTVDSLRTIAPRRVLDIADLSEEMMAVGRRKAAEAGLSDRIAFEQQDCMALTYADASFDAVTVAFGVRNYADLERGLGEMYRVLRPGGGLRIVELSAPCRFPMKQLYGIYSSVFMPLVGGWFGLEKDAYRYLPASIRKMPQGEDMAALLRRQGFTDVRVRTFTGGVCTLYAATK